MPNDTTPAPIGADALREALWICVEHNALHFGETHNTVVQGRAALASAAQPSDAAWDKVLRERDDADDFIDALLDEVLGADRPEWSNLYDRADALDDVRERMAVLEKPASAQFRRASPAAAIGEANARNCNEQRKRTRS